MTGAHIYLAPPAQGEPAQDPIALRKSARFALLVVIVALFRATGVAAQQSDADLAAAAQNPVAATYSLPFQNNIFGGAGPQHDAVGNVLNIQPVLPFTFGDWNVISRTIVPLIYVPGLVPGLSDNPGMPAGTSSVFGLGDINQTFYISPAASKGVIWGLGPSVTLPTATNSEIGSGKLSVGPGAVALVMPKPWVIGILGRQLWSVAGPSSRKDVNQLLLQPFVNYNLPGGWYLVSAPIMTADWTATSSNRWTVPVGGGAGKIFRIGSQPINASLQAYKYPIRTSLGPTWDIRFQVQFLFPR
jgi:hypothetical protein